MVIEGQINRSLNGQTVRFLVLANTGHLFGCFAVEKDRPALLEECEKCLPIRHQRLKRPVIEKGALTQELNEPLVQHRRDALTAIVTAQQHPQEIRWLFDQLGRDFKDMPEDELLGSVMA